MSHRRRSMGYYKTECVSGVLLLGLLTACGGKPLPSEEEAMSPEPSSEQSASPTTSGKKPPKPGNTGAANSNEPGSPDGGLATGDGGAAGEPSSSSSVDPEVPPHVPVIDPDYPGLDEALAPDVDVPGCASDGYDEETATIQLTLSEEVFGVRLSAKDGHLFANGRQCANGDAELLLEDLERIAVVGGAEDNVVILDLSEGDFGQRLFEQAGGFHLTLGTGVDQFLLRGSAGDDELYAGSGSNRLMFALTSTARINVWGKDVESVIVSTGPGNDSLQYVGRLNVGLFDVDTGGSINPSELTIPARLYGGTGDDVLVSGKHDDLLIGGPGDDVVSAGEGNDVFDEETESNGTDVLNGGGGLDEVSYRLRGNPLKLELCISTEQDGCDAPDCDCTTDNGESEEGDTLVNLERVRSGTGDDVITGTSGDDYLYGERGDDRILGLGGADLLQGGEGNDLFDGGDDGDICDADPGEAVMSCEI